jgi:hypothetical protein
MKFNHALIIGMLAISSCDGNKNVDFEKIYTYPTSIGSEWFYESELISRIYETSTSLDVVDADTLKFIIHVKVEKDTILNDTMHVIQFISEIEEFGRYSNQYFFVDSEGLKAYAYSDDASHIFVKKNLPQPFASFVNTNIWGPSFSDNEDFIVFEPKPRLNLKMPLELHSKWTYTTPYNPLNLQIDKEIVGYETLKINNQSYSCYKITWIYLENKYFDDTKINDWISKEGLIKRQIIYDRTPFDNSETESIAFSELTETIILK